MDKLLTRAQTPFTIAMLVAKRKSEGGANDEASSEKNNNKESNFWCIPDGFHFKYYK